MGDFLGGYIWGPGFDSILPEVEVKRTKISRSRFSLSTWDVYSAINRRVARLFGVRQGVFDTLLENEYALMTLALKKATDDDMNALYDIEDIYEWSDYVRRMGIDQVFS